MRLRVLSLAEDDIWNGYRFYERQSPGLGDVFLQKTFDSVESLLRAPGIHRGVHGFHRLLTPRFPFAIYYQIAGEELQVWRVFDCRRDPMWIERELRR